MPREDAPLADEPQPAAVPNDMPQGRPDVEQPGNPPGDAPSGLPRDDAPESTPLGPDEPAPEGEAAPRRGEHHQPGIPTEGEPPSGG